MSMKKINNILKEKGKLLELIRFGIVGVLAVAIHYGLYFILLPYMDRNIAFTIGYGISFICNFLLSSWFTFQVKTSWSRFVKFGASHGINYLLNIILLNLFCWMGCPEKWAPLPVYAVAVPLNFLLVRFALTKKIRK